MVTTRAQARRAQVNDGADGDDATLVNSDSSSDDDRGARNGRSEKRTTPVRVSSVSRIADRNSAPLSSYSSARASPPSAPEGERLGRGCRVARSSMSLDEEYLIAALSRSNKLPRGAAIGGSSQSHASHVESAFVVNRRYPVREAAKRAMENLHVTLTSANGAASLENNGDETEESSNSMGVFHFRNHPELVAEIQSQQQRASRRRRRGRRGGGGGRGTSSDDNSSSGSNEDGSGSSGDDSGREVGHAAATRRRLPLSVSNNLASPAVSSPRVSGGAASYITRATRDDDAVSLDSSISAVSLRDESVERAAAQDRRAATDDDDDDDDDKGGSEDGTRDFANDAERKRALRNARESVRENINLNHYMPDAVGVVDARRVRRQQLDRRYKWLMHEHDEAARTQGEGGADVTTTTTTANGALGDISPLRVDDGVTFDSVGGLPEHIVTLREMVLLPLLYPDLFEQLDLRAPRGVLFVGPPGTGKTLMARALANEGSRFAVNKSSSSSSSSGIASPSSSSSSPQQQQQRITFFVRKGADMLSKWVGESERQLKLLFEEAKRLQPSIIFFDEVDGLAPTRHAKTEQTQAALVSTLLALLDGLEDRGQVVVIGATNRPDTLDPALRRPGRFDRELVFPLPDAAARRHILSIQLAKKALPASEAQQDALLADLTEMTEGYSGADLGALCTEASLHRLRTALPELYLSRHRLAIPPEVTQARLHVRTEDFYAAAQRMQPSLRRCCHSLQGDSAFLDPYVEVLVRGTRNATLAALAPSWSLVDKVLRAGARDCQDMATAVRTLCAVPIPQPPRACLLVLHEATQSAHEQQQQQQQQHLHHLSLSLLQGLPGLHHITVHLPQLQWEDGVGGSSSSASGALWSALTRGSALNSLSGGGEDYLGAGAAAEVGFTHMCQVVQSVRQCSPCVVYLSGAEEWLTELHDVEEADDDEDQDSAASETTEQEKEEGKEDDRWKATRSGAASRRRQRRRVQIFRYYLNVLADTDVIFLLPCATAATRALLLGSDPAAAERRDSINDSGSSQPTAPAGTVSFIGHSVSSGELHSANSLSSPSSPILAADPPTAVQLTRAPPSRQQLHPQFSIVYAGIATTPLPADLRRFVQYIHRIVRMTLRLHHHATEGGTATATGGAGDVGVQPLAEDTAPLPPTGLAAAQARQRRRADRSRRCQLWRKVEYRRLQLRHVLMKWVGQYIHSGKYKLLANADLDLAPDDPLSKAWRQHTRHHRLGLQDVLEKIEGERYVCLSQYHDDIEQIVRNVRSFFRTRAPQDQRYRLKALDLKETSLLNMYKMNRQVIRFCEETRDMREPSSSEDDDDNSDGDAAQDAATALVRKEEDPALVAEQSRRAVSFAQRPAAPVRKRTRPWSYRGERRRRRKKAGVAKRTKTEPAGAPTQDNEASAEGDASAPSSVNADCVDVEINAASDEEDEEESGEEGERKADDAAPLAADDSEGSVETWACVLLSTLTYTRLYHVFKSVMRGLEVEVRLLNERAAQRKQQQQQEQQPQDALHCEVAANTSSLPSREQYVTSVFRRLVLAAVQE